MRVLLFLASFLCVMAAGAQPAATRAENGLLYLDQKDFGELKALDSAEFDPAAVYQERILLVVDFFNCLACNYYLSKTLENTGDIPVVIIVKNLPEGQLEAFRQEFRINPAFKVIANSKYQYFLNRTFFDKDKSFVLRYYPQLRVVKYANILDQHKLTQLLRPEGKLAFTSVACDTIALNIICNGIEDFDHIGEDYFFIAYPSQQLMHIGKDKKATVVKIPEHIIRDQIFEVLWKELLPVQREFNSYEKSMKLQEKDYKPMGQELYHHSTIEARGDTLYSTLTFMIPYKKFHTMIWVEAYRYVAAFNKDGELVGLDSLGWHTDGVYTERPWGFSGTIRNYTIGVDANDSLTYYKSKKIVFAQTVAGKNAKKHTMPGSVFLPYWQKLKQYALIHRYFNDSLLYFEYMPYTYDLNSGKLTYYPQFADFSPGIQKNMLALENQGYYYTILQSGYYQVMLIMLKDKLVDFKVLDRRFTMFANSYTYSTGGFQSLEFSTEGKLLLKTYRLP